MKILPISAAILAWLMASASVASPTFSEPGRIEALVTDLANAAPTATDASFAHLALGTLSRSLGLEVAPGHLPQVTRPLLPDSGTPEVTTGVLQIALTQLAILEGANNQLRVLRGQNGATDAIFLRGGATSLRSLADAAAAANIPGLYRDGSTIVISRPLVIWQGAGLRLEPGDHLRIDSDTGAFLISFGDLDLRDADVAATTTSTKTDAFRGFLLVSGQGTLFAEDTHFSGLGMGGIGLFSGLVASTSGLFPPAFPPILRANRLDRMGGIGLVGISDAVVADNLIQSSTGTALTLGRVADALVTGNAIIGTADGAGLKISDQSHDLLISGNLIAIGGQNGMTIGGNSRQIILSGNAILQNGETGVAIQRASCLNIADNTIALSGATALRLTQSGYARIAGNALLQNATAALSIGAQVGNSRIEVTGNLMAGNRVGVTGGGLATVDLSGNDLSHQLPRLFDGEFSQHLVGYLNASPGDAAVFRIAAQSTSPADFNSACSED